MKRLATAIALTAALAVPTVASAATIKQEGQIVKDDATSVKLRIKTNSSGKATKVAGFKAKNVRTNCDDGPTRISFTALQPVDIDNGKFKVRLSDDNGGILRLSGKVSGDAKSVTGKLKTNNFEGSGGQTCKTPKQKFKTEA
jgi:hypothetical protein